MGDQQGTGTGEVPERRLGSNGWRARYPPGYGDEPRPDFQGRASWHLIDTYGPAHQHPKVGETWRFLIDATPGSQKTEDKRWVEAIIPPGQGGQGKHLFAARHELGIPGTAPVIHVDDPTPALARTYQNYLPGTGFYFEKLSPPRRVRDEWGRTPAQAAAAAAAIAAAQTQAKAAASARAGVGFHS